MRGSTIGLFAKRTARDGEETCAKCGTTRRPVGIAGTAKVCFGVANPAVG